MTTSLIELKYRISEARHKIFNRNISLVLAQRAVDDIEYLAGRVNSLLKAAAEQGTRFADLVDKVRTHDNEVSQLLGKALGYPWFKDDQENFPGSTEADGVVLADHTAHSLAGEAAAKIEVLTKRIMELEQQVYVPGMFKCAKCGFVLIKNFISFETGMICANDQPDRCNNCDVPLWRVTERDAGNTLIDQADEYLARAVAAETALSDKFKGIPDDDEEEVVIYKGTSSFEFYNEVISAFKSGTPWRGHWITTISDAEIGDDLATFTVSGRTA